MSEVYFPGLCVLGMLRSPSYCLLGDSAWYGLWDRSHWSAVTGEGQRCPDVPGYSRGIGPRCVHTLSAVSSMQHTLSMPLPAVLVKLPRLCCNTHSQGWTCTSYRGSCLLHVCDATMSTPQSLAGSARPCLVGALPAARNRTAPTLVSPLSVVPDARASSLALQYAEEMCAALPMHANGATNLVLAHAEGGGALALAQVGELRVARRALRLQFCRLIKEHLHVATPQWCPHALPALRSLPLHCTNALSTLSHLTSACNGARVRCATRKRSARGRRRSGAARVPFATPQVQRCPGRR